MITIVISPEDIFPNLHTGNAIKELRYHVAEMIGVKRNDISEMENGKRRIDEDMAKRLARELNTDYKVFF